jgi:hypothetical protein
MMNRERFVRMAPALGPALLGLGLTVTACTATSSAGTSAAVGPSSASPAPAATSAVSPANAAPVDVDGKPFVVWDCDGKPQVEPTTFVLSCADNGTGWTAARWTKWAGADASGVGIQYWKNCVPDCAEGKVLALPVDISLTGSYLAAQGKPFSYTKVTFTYTTSARPTIYVTVHGKVKATHPATWTLALPVGHATGTAGGTVLS